MAQAGTVTVLGGGNVTPAKKLIITGGRKFKNFVANGNFALVNIDSDGNGIADGWTGGGSNFVNPRVENNTQYWTPLKDSTYSSSLATRDYIMTPSVSNHKFYVAFIGSNIMGLWGILAGKVYRFSKTSGEISAIIPATFNYGSSGNQRIVLYAHEANVESSVKNFILIDLTAEFGEGNEPDLAWCDANIPQNIIW